VKGNLPIGPTGKTMLSRWRSSSSARSHWRTNRAKWFRRRRSTSIINCSRRTSGPISTTFGRGSARPVRTRSCSGLCRCWACAISRAKAFSGSGGCELSVDRIYLGVVRPPRSAAFGTFINSHRRMSAIAVPTELVTAHSGADMLEFMRHPDFDFTRKAVVGSPGRSAQSPRHRGASIR
jgi:hypothetical protein